jgi:putative FmdB family regulatory protein
MPIYAYKCESCGHTKDVLQKMSDAPLTDCPQCGAPAFKKQLTAAGFQLKGSGWYVTDFRGGSAATAPAADGPAEGAKGSGKSADTTQGSAGATPPASGNGTAATPGGAASASAPAPVPVPASPPVSSAKGGSSPKGGD